MTDAQTWINGNTDPATTTKILPTTATPPGPGSTEVKNPVIAGNVASRLTGELIIKDYLELTEIDLSKNEIEKITFINCPKLKTIHVEQNKKLKILDIKKLEIDNTTNKPKANKLVNLFCGGNIIEVINFTYCEEIVKFECPNNPKLDRIEDLDKCKKVEVVNMDKSGPVRIMNEVKQGAFKAVAEQVKEIFGVDSVGGLPMEQYTDDKGRKQNRIKKDALKTQLMDHVIAIQSPQLKTDKANVEKERDAAQANYNTAKTELDQLKQQLENIRKELGLGQNATGQQFIDKIKALMKRPSGPACTHTDYDTIKGERDNLKNELAAKNRRISELENSNKENNKDKDAITKKALIDSTNSSLAELGINISSEQKEKMKDATVQGVEEVRNEIIKTELGKLKQENKSSFYLNLGLGALTIGSLVLLVWIMMRETNLPKMETEKKDQK